jgi:type I restriction enzyme S subunit
MSSTSERTTTDQTRTYDRASSVVFLKTAEPFGGLSNMAGGFPLHVQGARVYTSEALYQACRFPHLTEVQRLIIGQASPMTAKMKGKPHRNSSRPDWDRVRVNVMRWCLRMKLAQNWEKFSELLLRTGDRPIVEESRRDDFWGAKPVGEETLVGMNVLGRLLMELREAVKSQGREAFRTVEPPDIPEFLLFGRPIEAFSGTDTVARGAVSPASGSATDGRTIESTTEQTSLFDAPAAREAPAPTYMGSQVPERAPLGELKPYPAMKDSGASWLGDVPEHWQVRPNRAIFTEVKERDHPEADMLSVTITKGVIRQQALLEDSSKKDSSNLDKSAYKLVRPGDIAYNKMRAWQGAVGVSEYEGIVSPAYVVQRPREGAAPRYLHYLLRTPAFAKEAERWSYGITSDMWSLRPEHFKMIYSCLPPLPEQAAIVRFLDHADRRIRRYIRAKQKLIKLLEEQKQAIIHRAVTRGLDPNVRLKPSGVEWLGDVPAHWKIAELRRIVRKGRTITYGIVQPGGHVDGGRPMVRAQDYSFGWTTPEHVYHVAEAIELPYRRSRLETGDIVYTIVGQGSVGNVAIVPACFAGANITQTTARISVDRELAQPRYVAAVLDGPIGQTQLRRRVKGVGQPGINLGHLRLYQIPLPPVKEQMSIVRFLETTIAQHDAAIASAQRGVGLLREYRIRLIADVVTGKFDVREAAARLPKEAYELEPLDDTEADLDEGAVGDGDEIPEDAEA